VRCKFFNIVKTVQVSSENTQKNL